MSTTNTTPKEFWSPPPSFTSPKKRAPAKPPFPTATNWSTSSSFLKATSTASASSLRKWWIRTVRPFDCGPNSSQTAFRFGNSFIPNAVGVPFRPNPKAHPDAQPTPANESSRPFIAAYAGSTLVFDGSMHFSLRGLKLMLSYRLVNEGQTLSALPQLLNASPTDDPASLASRSPKSFRSNTYEIPVNTDSKRLTEILSPLDATF